MRKYMSISMLALFLVSLTVAAGAEMKEAPVLAELVKAGTLPPVSERLPEEPLVVKVFDRIGTYGGTFQEAQQEYKGEWPLMRLLTEPWINLDYDHSTLIPWSITKWEWQNDEASVIRMFIRKGMKWSDGEPITVDDYLFYCNDMLLNPDFLASPPSWLYANNTPAEVTRVDDYTFDIDFKSPFGMFPFAIANWNARSPYYNGTHVVPKHYLEQFHPDYAKKEDLAAAIADGMYNSWPELITSKANYRINPDLPTMAAFKVMNGLNEPIQYLERNPYYWAVDEEGNQLPYADKWERTLVTDENAMLIKIFAGEFWFAKLGSSGGTSQYPALIENQEKGDYGVRFYDLPAFSAGCIWVNPHHEDPVKSELLLNFKFRQALSVALDRDEINESIFFGMGVPSQVAPDKLSPVYGDDSSIWEVNSQYDPDAANALLDEIGLTDRDDKGFRLGPDGNELLLVLSTNIEWPSETVKMCELYKQYFADIGINVVVKALKNNILYPQIEANDYDLFVRAFIAGGNIQPSVNHYVFPQSSGWHMGPLWAAWLLSDGEKGVEPEEWVKELLPLQDQIKGTKDDAERFELMRKAVLLHVENLMPIGGIQWGGVGSPQNAIAVSNKLGNVPENPDGLWVASKIAQWFIK